MSDETVTLNWTPFALNCLDEIHDHIIFKAKSTEPADKLINTIFDRTEQLKSFPESGQQVPFNSFKNGMG